MTAAALTAHPATVSLPDEQVTEYAQALVLDAICAGVLDRITSETGNYLYRVEIVAACGLQGSDDTIDRNVDRILAEAVTQSLRAFALYGIHRKEPV